jgi:glycosyltransferase involved in cell wall biosynthesis
MTRPRVAFVGWRLGSELEGVIRAGRDRFDYTVISMDLPEPLRAQVEWLRLPRPPLGSFRLGWALFFAFGGLRLARAGADLVHCVGPLPVVPNRVDVDTVTFCQAAYDEATAGRIKGSASAIGWRLGQRFTVALERWWFGRRVDVLVGISEGSAADLRRHYPGVRVEVVPRGIDLRRFSPDEDDRRRVRSERGVPHDAVVALFVDQQYRPLKGLEIAIRAFAAAHAAGAGPDLLWVAGAGNDRYAPLAQSLGVADRVRFLGHTAAIERLYRGADVFVLPTAYEAFCRAAHEAAACGLPVVAPPVNGIRELIGDDEAGMVVSRDPAAVAHALTSVCGDRERRARMGAVARRRVAEFDEEAVSARMLALHESLLGGRQPTGPAASG